MSITNNTTPNGSPQLNGRPLQTVPPVQPDDEQPATTPAPTANRANPESKRVQRLREQVTEARGVVELQDDPALTEADTPKVLTERRKSSEALKLHTLGQDPARKALRDNRVRRAVAFLGGTGLVVALGWSTANVHDTVSTGQHLTATDLGWWLAFGVEPMVSVGLLLIFFVRAYKAVTCGYTIVDPTLRKIETVLLAITLTVNSWPYLPFIADKFDPLQLLVHSIGPVIAVLLVTAIPILWQYLADAGPGVSTDPEFTRLMTQARQLIADGQLAPDAGRNATERALREHGGRISTATANRVYRCLTGNANL